MEDFITACQGIEKLLIDVTERLHRRPQDGDKQSEMYSEKEGFDDDVIAIAAGLWNFLLS
ncbi:MAG: hypothetical protein KKD28_03255 [Chloroflexi bacterium]|nr:hypothetical protein [Chloroflexota bacterium]